jgi:hypothetical protein
MSVLVDRGRTPCHGSCHDAIVELILHITQIAKKQHSQKYQLHAGLVQFESALFGVLLSMLMP